MRILSLLPVALSTGLLFAVPAHAQATRNYDCTKAGNANKMACKQAATPKPAIVTPAASPTVMKTMTARHYDCTKAGNLNKTACKGAPSAIPAAPAAPAPRATVATRSVQTHTVSTTTTRAAGTNAAGPDGATAICNDGSYSHSAHRSGTCSRHGGVKTFY